MDRLLSDEREVHHFGFSSTFLISECKFVYNSIRLDCYFINYNIVILLNT